MLAIRGGRPELLNLRDIIEAFVKFREEVITRRSKFELAKARDRAHILLGLVIAVTNLDEVVRIIRGSSSPAEARDALLAREWPIAEIAALHPPGRGGRGRGHRRHLSPVRHPGPRDPRPAPAPPDRARPRRDRRRAARARRLDRRAARNPRQPRRALRGDARGAGRGPRRLRHPAPHRDRRRRRRDRRRGSDRARGHGRHRDGRRAISSAPRSTPSARRTRGGKGRAGMATKDEDAITNLFVTSTHTPVLFFSTHGKVYRMKVWRLPEGGAGDARAADDQPAAAGGGRDDLDRAAAARGRGEVGRAPRHVRHRQGHRAPQLAWTRSPTSRAPARSR